MSTESIDCVPVMLMHVRYIVYQYYIVTV